MAMLMKTFMLKIMLMLIDGMWTSGWEVTGNKVRWQRPLAREGAGGWEQGDLIKNRGWLGEQKKNRGLGKSKAT